MFSSGASLRILVSQIVSKRTARLVKTRSAEGGGPLWPGEDSGRPENCLLVSERLDSLVPFGLRRLEAAEAKTQGPQYGLMGIPFAFELD